VSYDATASNVAELNITTWSSRFACYVMVEGFLSCFYWCNIYCNR